MNLQEMLIHEGNMNNKIIVAMDMEIPEGIKLISQLRNSPEIYGYKIGSLWILDRGLDILKSVRDMLIEVDSTQKIILDMQKWGTDIPDIVKKQVEKVAPYVEELICCPMGAGSDSLKMFVNTCYANDTLPICVLEMTQPNSDKYLINGSKTMILDDCFNCGLNSFVLPATKTPDKTFKTLIDFYYGKTKANLYATGFKVQGGQTKPMVEFGVTKFIVGRAIYEATNPINVVHEIYQDINNEKI